MVMVNTMTAIDIANSVRTAEEDLGTVEHTGVIYLLVNTVNGMMYVGQTVNYKRRMGTYSNPQADTHIIRAIRKYGWDNFKSIILHSNVPVEDLDALERYCIWLWDTYHNGYNMTLGGGGKRGYVWSEESRAKAGATQRAKYARGEHHMQNPEIAAKAAAKRSATHRAKATRGEHHTQRPEVKAKIKSTHLARVARGEHNMQDPEVRAKACATHRAKAARGEHQSQRPEVKAKIKATHLARVARGEHPMHNPEIAAKNSASKKAMYADPARRTQKIAKSKLTRANNDRRKLEDAGHVFMLDGLEDVTHEDIIADGIVK